MKAWSKPSGATSASTSPPRSLCAGLEPEARYRVTNLDTEATEESTGRELMERGLTVAITPKPGSALLVYKKLKATGS